MSEDKPIYKKAGGARPGAGRPKTKQKLSVYVDIDLYNEFKDVKDKNGYINKCIREHQERIAFRIEEVDAMQ